MRIALSQMDCTPGDVPRNVARMIRDVEMASEAGCDLVVFPEMSDTGYHLPTILKTASPWDGGPFKVLSDAAARKNIAVIAGLSERVAEGVYNTLAVISRDGSLVEKYRKIHLATVQPIHEEQFLQSGDRAVTCDLDGVRIGLMICYDIRFPELARRLTLDGAELLVVPAAFPKVRIDHWSLLTRARAVENQCYLAAVNRVGEDAGMLFGGASALWDPTGERLTKEEAGEALLIAEIDLARVKTVRNHLQVFRDRRPDCY